MVALPQHFNMEPAYKEQFATFLEAGFSAFVAAQKIWPSDGGFSYHIAQIWVNDPYVVAFRDKLRDDKAAEAKPKGKEKLIKLIEDKLQGMTDDNFLKGVRLVSEMQGYIEKAAPPSVTVNNNNQVSRVMVVKDHGSDEQWEAKLKAQQAKLIEHNG